MGDPIRNVWLWWSSGKDSAWALHRIAGTDGLRVTGLVTTFNASANRVAMHAVRRQLLERQADAAGVPVRGVDLPSPCSNAEYEAAVEPVLGEAVDAGIELMAFGDLFLEDVRDYRVSMLRGRPIEALFPIWGLDTKLLSRQMVDAGLEAYVTCVDPRVLESSFAGRRFDHDFLDALPPQVDPCGENGEFHTFAFAGPMFSTRLAVTPGDVVEHDGFVFADLLPA